MIFEKVMTVVPEDPEGPEGPDEKASSRSPDADPSDGTQRPVPPVQSREDTDVGWGERHEPEDDERLYSERPPHWESL
jgi:hypothetical protein